MSNEEKIEVYKLALLLDPKIFISAGIFIVDSKLLLDDSDNEFYKIEDERIGVHINQNVMVGGKVVKVLNIMACNDSWLNRFYYLPLQEIKMIFNVLSSRGTNCTDGNYNNSFQRFNPQDFNDPKPVIIQEFKTQPIYVTCTNCNSIITTKTKPKLNCLACLCFLLFCPLYCCIKLCAGKDVCCLDYTHLCPNCGRVLGVYETC